MLVKRPVYELSFSFLASMRAQTASLLMNSCLPFASSWILSNNSLILIYDLNTLTLSSVWFKASNMKSISSSAVAMKLYLARSVFRRSSSAYMLSSLYEISMRVRPYWLASSKSFERK